MAYPGGSNSQNTRNNKKKMVDNFLDYLQGYPNMDEFLIEVFRMGMAQMKKELNKTKKMDLSKVEEYINQEAERRLREMFKKRRAEPRKPQAKKENTPPEDFLDKLLDWYDSQPEDKL